MELFKAFAGLLSTHATTTIYYLHDPNEFHMHRRLIGPHQLATMPVQTSYTVQAQHQQHHLRSRSITQASERKMWSIFQEKKSNELASVVLRQNHSQILWIYRKIFWWCSCDKWRGSLYGRHSIAPSFMIQCILGVHIACMNIGQNAIFRCPEVP